MLSSLLFFFLRSGERPARKIIWSGQAKAAAGGTRNIINVGESWKYKFVLTES